MFMALSHTLSETELYRQIERDLFGLHTPSLQDRVGLELELFLLRKEHEGMRPVELAGDHGVLALMDGLAATHGWRMQTDEFGNASIDLPCGGNITLEPAGQIEYSTPALPTAADAIADMESAIEQIAQEAARSDMQLISSGYNNLCAEEALVLQVAKPRYRYMDAHFQRIGLFGRKMMRATCALQINLDFGPPEIASERWRLANMIAPSLNAMFANSPYLYGGRHYRSFRYEIWRRTDPSRTGRLYDRPDLDPIADYLRFALDAEVMLICDGSGGCRPMNRPITFRQWLAERTLSRPPTLDDWRLHLTTLFPDVRPKGWMELRTVDCLPQRWRSVPVSFATTLLYNDTLRRSALDLLESSDRQCSPNEHEHDGAWQSDVMTGRMLLEMVIPQIGDDDLAATAEEYLERYLRRGITPAEHR